jgi:hypothetical protein
MCVAAQTGLSFRVTHCRIAFASLPECSIGRFSLRPIRCQKRSREGKEMSFGIYIVGYIILIIGLTIGANMLHLPPKWILVGVLCLVGVAIMHGVTATRQRDPSS